MTIAYVCLLVAMFLPYFFVGYAKFGGPGFNNKTTRDFLATLEGKRKRAYWAHLNQFESFPPFAASVIVAHQLGGAQTWIDLLAVGFIIVRVLYFFCYLTDKASLRSLAWFGGVICIVSLFVTAFNA